MESNAEIRHESGLVFEDAKHDRSGSWPQFPQQCWGTMLNRPQFSTVEAFEQVMTELDTVQKVEVKVQDEVVQDWKAVRSDRSGKVYSFVSNEYMPVQDEQVIGPFLQAAKERGLKPVGRFDGIGSGRTRGHVVLTNPEFKVQLLKAYDDPMMLGVKLDNSFNKESGFGAEIFGVRMVCVNYNLWGEVMGGFRHSHYRCNEDVLKSYTALMEQMLNKVPTLQQKVELAFNTPVLKAEVEDLLWGINLPIRGRDEVLANTSYWVPEVGEWGLNGWTLYNGVTAYITHRERSGMHLQATEQYARDAVRLLTTAHDKLIEQGREKREAYEKAKFEREAQKVAQKVEVRQVA